MITNFVLNIFKLLTKIKMCTFISTLNGYNHTNINGQLESQICTLIIEVQKYEIKVLIFFIDTLTLPPILKYFFNLS